MTKWIRLERGNDWGTDYWTLPGESLNPLGLADKSRGLPLLGGEFTVKFPDGSIGEVKICSTREWRTHYCQETLHAEHEALGIPLQTDLRHILFSEEEIMNIWIKKCTQPRS